ncbi:hypothetical protein ACB098_11G182000 [Castanea mollissima]
MHIMLVGFLILCPRRLSFQPKIMICTDNRCIVIFAAVGSYSINIRQVFSLVIQAKGG